MPAASTMSACDRAVAVAGGRAQLVLMGYLPRIVNGGGHVEREYGISRDRIDLLVRWPYQTLDGKRGWQREALELKVWRDRESDPLDAGLGVGEADEHPAVVVALGESPLAAQDEVGRGGRGGPQQPEVPAGG
jgi:hypothetical protein